VSDELWKLTPDAQAAAESALADLRANGTQVVVTCTLRTAEEQYALWCQGRKSLNEVNEARARAGMRPILEYLGRDGKTHSDNEYTVTTLDGKRKSEGGTGRSPHQLGTAIDVVPDLDETDKERPGWPPLSDKRWTVIADAFKAHGFEWGGDWADYPDYPHYQRMA